MRTPNLFILGAPKCGTTSMAEWLADHPKVFMSKLKEPHYFNKDHKHNSVVNYDHYLSLFNSATDIQTIVGEASVWYLYSEVAVKNIIKNLGNNLKFIVMLRNPVQMAYSLHEQQVFNLNEPETDFKKAWNLQEERRRNKKLATTTRDAKLLLYGETCKLGNQVERLLNIVESKKIKFILLDDLKEDALKIYKETLDFLDVEYDGRTNFVAVNAGKVRKSKSLAFMVKALGLLKQKLKITKGFGILNKTNQTNIKDFKRKPLNPEFRSELVNFFDDDIKKLENLIKRDLSNWRK